VEQGVRTPERKDRRQLDALLATREDAQESRSPFYAAAREATRENLKMLIAHYEWLRTLIDPVPLLSPISEAKIAQWANEAQRLKARELREYVAPRRYALVLAALRETAAVARQPDRHALKLSGRIEWRSGASLDDWHTGRRKQTEELIRALADILTIAGDDSTPEEKIGQLDATLTTTVDASCSKLPATSIWGTRTNTGSRSLGSVLALPV